MNYPPEILPQPNFKKITEDLSEYLVCRKIPPELSIISISPILDEKLIGLNSENECFDYSTNLPGIFKLWHNRIELTGDNKKQFRSYWDWVSTVYPPEYKKDFYLNENTSYFFLKIGEVEQITIPFNKNGKRKLDNILRCVVVHTPTNCNFWHFSIRWRDSHGIFISANSATWKYKMIATIRAILCQLIICNTKNQQIDVGWYLKS